VKIPVMHWHVQVTCVGGFNILDVPPVPLQNIQPLLPTSMRLFSAAILCDAELLARVSLQPQTHLVIFSVGAGMLKRRHDIDRLVHLDL